jgi:hypothetical protein
MDIFWKLLIYAVCVGYSVSGAYSLGFKMGEDKGRKDMLNEITQGR